MRNRRRRTGVLRLPFHQPCMLPALVVVLLSSAPYYFLLESVWCKPREDRYFTLVKCIIPRVAVRHALFCPRSRFLKTRTCVQFFCLDKRKARDHPLPVSILPQREEERLKAGEKNVGPDVVATYLVVHDVSNSESNSCVSACVRTTLTVRSDGNCLLVG